MHESEWHPKPKIYDEKLNKWHPQTNKTDHHDVVTYVGTYIELHRHIRLRVTTQVRLTSHLHTKS